MTSVFHRIGASLLLWPSLTFAHGYGPSNAPVVAVGPYGIFHPPAKASPQPVINLKAQRPHKKHRRPRETLMTRMNRRVREFANIQMTDERSTASLTWLSEANLTPENLFTKNCSASIDETKVRTTFFQQNELFPFAFLIAPEKSGVTAKMELISPEITSKLTFWQNFGVVRKNGTLFAVMETREFVLELMGVLSKNPWETGRFQGTLLLSVWKPARKSYCRFVMPVTAEWSPEQ